MHLIKQQQPCLSTRFQKPELLEDTDSIALLYTLQPLPCPALVLAALPAEQRSCPRCVPAFSCARQEIHYPGGWQLGGRSGTLPVGAARSQLGVLPEQQFARQTRCSSLYSILFCFCSSCLCCLADKLFLDVPWPSGA